MKIANRKSQIANAFTLIELLVVIAIIAVLVAFAIPVLGYVKRTQYISHATGEMNQIETALESYKNAYHFYPPDNGTNLVNQLYYELVGTTNIEKSPELKFMTLDGTETLTATDLKNAFGVDAGNNPNVSGFVNCSKPGAGGEDSAAAQNFIHELKPNQTKTFTNNTASVTLLVTGVGGPDQNYKPLGVLDLNPWRYRYPGVNNPTGYDLWIQLVINGQTNLICNWSKKPHINDLSVP